MLALTNCKAVTIANGIIESATILVDGNKLLAVGVGKEVEIPTNAEVIDLNGKWVTPGFIDAHSHLAMGEPGVKGGGDDDNEATDPVTAHVRMIDSLDPWSIGIPEARKGGFTCVCSLPGSANVIGGTGVAVKLKDSNSVLDIVIPGTEVMKMALGENPKGCYGAQKRMPMTRMGIGAVLRETLFNAKQYADEMAAAEKEGKPFKHNFKLDPLVPVVRGEMRCRIHCHRADDILTAVRIGEEFGLDFVVEHCTEGFMIADILAKKQVKCVVGPLRLIPGKMEIWNCTMENPGKMEQAGVEFALSADAQTATRWLPEEVGIAMAYGLSEETAFKALTIHAAKILNLEHRMGTLEPGKDADLAVFDGHPFSNMTRCKATMIDGVFYFNELEN